MPLAPRPLITAVLVAAGWRGSLAAQATTAPSLTASMRAAVIDSAVARLNRLYVEPDTARLIGEGVQGKLKAGDYDRLENPAQFAEAVTKDLRAVNGDLHLSLRYQPNPGNPSVPGGGDPRLQNFGVARAEILEGNVGYLEIAGFMGAPGYRDAVVDALRLLSRTDAMIIDVRRNPGGSGEMSHFLFSHFLGATPVPTIRVKRRPPSEAVVRESLAEVPGPRRPEVPLFVLTSQGTGSAAEEFSFVLKNQRRATIVGTRTAGAGHMVTFAPIVHGFVLGASITRVSDPATGTEWEGVGVQPDLAVPAERALMAAHAAAVRAVGAAADPARQAFLARLGAWLEGRLRPPPPAAELGRWTGDYEGRVVSLQNGALHYARRGGAIGEPLVALGGGRFALGATQYLFEDRGGVVTLVVEQPDGTRVTFRKTA